MYTHFKNAINYLHCHVHFFGSQFYLWLHKIYMYIGGMEIWLFQTTRYYNYNRYGNTVVVLYM